jgi:DNA-binding CsgD family transcriptional regulator
MLSWHQGEPDRAWERVTQLLPQGPATEPGDSYFAHTITAVALAAELALDARDLTTARRWIETHDRWLDWSGAWLWQADNKLLWARLAELSGDLALVTRHAERALGHASNPRQPLRLVAIHRFLGRLESQQRQFSSAAMHLDRSLTLASACAAPFERALTLLALAELHIDTGRPQEAQTSLDEVRAICVPLHAAPTIARIDTLQSRLATPATPVPVYPDRLTTREVEVLRLIAAGQSNREIADALFLSIRTVERHIANIYLKIDTHSKAEATAYAFRNGLVDEPMTPA